MDNIPFGKTGVMVSELGFGGVPIIRKVQHYDLYE
jgi:aryl-alcohol dehydrogenase-like predicted oxidoreductase